MSFESQIKHQTSFGKFMYDVYEEQERARAKFPQGKNLLAALMEEVGESAEALLKITETEAESEQEQNDCRQEVYNELVQVAATAFRLASIGDKTYGYTGTKCSYRGCAAPAIGGPCPLCYE